MKVNLNKIVVKKRNVVNVVTALIKRVNIINQVDMVKKANQDTRMIAIQIIEKLKNRHIEAILSWKWINHIWML